MKNLIYCLITITLLWSCKTTHKTVASSNEKGTAKVSDTVRIANDDLKYEVIIIDPGFNSWLVSNAKPRTYYSLQYLEMKNSIFVSQWNSRVMQPFRYDPNLYGMQIDYDPNIHYGLEVNYLLYNYFNYFERKYHQKL